MKVETELKMGLYRYCHGSVCEVFTVAKSDNNDEILVIYGFLDKNNKRIESEVYYREINSFLSNVKNVEPPVKVFTYIGTI